MKHYDVMVVGRGLAALCGAAYLTLHGERVALCTNGGGKETLFMHRGLAVDDAAFSGPLVAPYFDVLGWPETRVSPPGATMVKADGHAVKRPRDAIGFKRYLVRHHPKEKDAIHAFFKKLSSHAQSYVENAARRLRGERHVHDTLQAEWKGTSLEAVLDKAFKTDAIKEAFLEEPGSLNTSADNIDAARFFIDWLARTPMSSKRTEEGGQVLAALKHVATKIDIFEGHIRDFLMEGDVVKRVTTEDETLSADAVLIEDVEGTRLKNKGISTGIDEETYAQERLYTARVTFDEDGCACLPDTDDVLFGEREDQEALRRVYRLSMASDDVTRMVVFHGREDDEASSGKRSLRRLDGSDGHVVAFEIVDSAVVYGGAFTDLSTTTHAIHTESGNAMRNVRVLKTLDTTVKGAGETMIEAVEVARATCEYLIEATDAGKPLSLDTLFAAFDHRLDRLREGVETTIDIRVGRRRARWLVGVGKGCIIREDDALADVLIETDYDTFADVMTERKGADVSAFAFKGDEDAISRVKATLESTRVRRLVENASTAHPFWRYLPLIALGGVSSAYVAMHLWPVFWIPLGFLAVFGVFSVVAFMLWRRLEVYDLLVATVFVTGVLSTLYLVSGSASVMLAFAGILLVFSSFFDPSFIAAYAAAGVDAAYRNTRLYRRMLSGLSLFWGFLFIFVAGIGVLLDAVYAVPVSVGLIMAGICLHFGYEDMYVKNVLRRRG